MRRSLGKIGLLYLLIVGSLHAAHYTWSVLKAPTQLHVGEGGIIRYQCAFDTSAGDYTIEFKPKDTQQYKASMVTQDDHVINAKRLLQFDVLISPLTSGDVTVNPEVRIRHTSFGSIEDASIGRDNVRKYDFTDEVVKLPNVTIKGIANTADLSGEITFAVQVDKQKVRAHEPVHLSLYVRGHGNLDQFVPFDVNISAVKQFSEPAYKDLSLQEDGYAGEVRQEFALVAEKSYVIPPFTLSVFDTKSHTHKILRSQPIAIEVEKGYVPDNLLDAPKLQDNSAWKRYGVYALFTVLGIILGEGVRWLWRHRPRKPQKTFWGHCTTSKELGVLLSLRDEGRYGEIIRMLDEGRLTLNEAKQRLRTQMSTHEE